MDSWLEKHMVENQSVKSREYQVCNVLHESNRNNLVL